MIETKKACPEYIARINRTFDYIETHIEKPMTLEELASIANFSKYHFNRIFLSIVGETPFQFILRIRLEKAATWIVNNKHEKISEIAYKCGFSDISIFSRNFKKLFSTICYSIQGLQKQKDSNNRQQEKQ